MPTMAEVMAEAMRLHREGRLRQAEPLYRQVLQTGPGHADALHLLGVIAHQEGRTDEAAALIRQALGVRGEPGFYNSLGVVLRRQGDAAAAAACYRQALRLRPDLAEAHNNLGNVLRDLGQVAEARACYEQAVFLRPDYADAHGNLGALLARAGEPGEALACYERALNVQPDNAQVHLDRALVWLQQGDYERGWAEYEWRWRTREIAPRAFPRPAWDGSPLAGRTILLHAEQGLGDTLHFIRYARPVKERGGTVIVQCPSALVPLLEGCPGIDRLAAEGEPLSPFDVHAPLLSLPHLLGTTLATVPAAVPYLHARPERIERWRRELEPIEGFRVGIAWHGNPQNRMCPHRSIPLRCFEALARLPGVRLVSLQKGPGTEQMAEVRDRFAVLDLGDRLDADGPFLDTAAVMRNLDLVVSMDTAAAHLAGALGVPVWLALMRVADWRWLLDRADSPWYPTARLFRQERAGDWEGVFARMAEVVGRSLRDRRPEPLLVEVSPGELADRLARLDAEAETPADETQRRAAEAERDALAGVWRRALAARPGLERLRAELRAVYLALRQAEDAVRACLRSGDEGPRLVEAVRVAEGQRERLAGRGAAVG